mmetsp:Transcript_6892/g.14876  ORF Transcript_6892/g.14876 Transcript_6892/m.14876 type:complete len:330 (-) Transcript_6892:557-1546(-)
MCFISASSASGFHRLQSHRGCITCGPSFAVVSPTAAAVIVPSGAFIISSGTVIVPSNTIIVSSGVIVARTARRRHAIPAAKLRRGRICLQRRRENAAGLQRHTAAPPLRHGGGRGSGQPHSLPRLLLPLRRLPAPRPFGPHLENPQGLPSVRVGGFGRFCGFRSGGPTVPPRACPQVRVRVPTLNIAQSARPGHAAHPHPVQPSAVPTFPGHLGGVPGTIPAHRGRGTSHIGTSRGDSAAGPGVGAARARGGTAGADPAGAGSGSGGDVRGADRGRPAGADGGKCSGTDGGEDGPGGRSGGDRGSQSGKRGAASGGVGPRDQLWGTHTF